MTSKQRAYLRGLANKIDSIFQVGKGGITDNLLTQLSDALEARELIKITVLKNAPDYARDIANEIAKVFIERVEDIYNIENVHVVDEAEVESIPSNINHTKDCKEWSNY